MSAPQLSRLPSIAFLRSVLSYSPSTGLLTWKVDRKSGKYGNCFSARAGQIAGAVKEDEGVRFYRHICVASHRISAHRVCWALHFGEWPSGVIDHIDGDGTNNRIENLRVCSGAENMKNRRLNSNSKSGFKGVHRFSDGVWRARISVDGRKRSLGLFSHPEEAAVAYDKAAQSLHGSFARTNKMLGLL